MKKRIFKIRVEDIDGIAGFIEVSADENGTVKLTNKKGISRFRPKITEWYFYVDEFGRIRKRRWENAEEDNFKLWDQKIFQSDCQCIHYLSYLKRKKQFEIEFEPGKDNFCFSYNYKSDELSIQKHKYNKEPGVSYFADEKYCKILLKEFGESYILAYDFDVYEENRNGR